MAIFRVLGELNGRAKSSSERWIRNMIVFNKVVKFWFYSAIYIDSLYIHVGFTLLTGCNVIVFATMPDTTLYSRNLVRWHEYLIFSFHLCAPLFGVINIVCWLRRNSGSSADLLCTFSRDFRADPNFDAARKLLFVAAIVQMWCFSVMFSHAAYTSREMMEASYYLFVDQTLWIIFILYLNMIISHFCISVCNVGQCLLRMTYAINGLNQAKIPEGVIRKFMGHYDYLIEVSDRLCKMQGPQIFFIVAHFLWTLVFEMYFIIWSVKYDNMWKTYNKYFLSIVQLAYLVLELGAASLLFTSCTINVSEAEKFNEALASLCMRDKTGTLVKNPYVTAHFAIGKKLKFSACGCFNIDYRLGYSMLAACITYLVILVEFDNKRDIGETIPTAHITSTTLSP